LNQSVFTDYVGRQASKIFKTWECTRQIG
jgi:viroplasmin and RNaseH domain-containing protein